MILMIFLSTILVRKRKKVSYGYCSVLLRRNNEVSYIINIIWMNVLSTQMQGSSVAYVSGSHRLDFVKKPLVATMS